MNPFPQNLREFQRQARLGMQALRYLERPRVLSRSLSQQRRDYLQQARRRQMDLSDDISELERERYSSMNAQRQRQLEEKYYQHAHLHHQLEDMGQTISYYVIQVDMAISKGQAIYAIVYQLSRQMLDEILLFTKEKPDKILPQHNKHRAKIISLTSRIQEQIKKSLAQDHLADHYKDRIVTILHYFPRTSFTNLLQQHLKDFGNLLACACKLKRLVKNGSDKLRKELRQMSILLIGSFQAGHLHETFGYQNMILQSALELQKSISEADVSEKMNISRRTVADDAMRINLELCSFYRRYGLVI